MWKHVDGTQISEDWRSIRIWMLAGTERQKKKKNDIEWSRIGGMYPMGYKRGRIVPGGVLLWPMSWAQRSQIHDMTGNVHRN